MWFKVKSLSLKRVTLKIRVGCSRPILMLYLTCYSHTFGDGVGKTKSFVNITKKQTGWGLYYIHVRSQEFRQTKISANRQLFYFVHLTDGNSRTRENKSESTEYNHYREKNITLRGKHISCQCDQCALGGRNGLFVSEWLVKSLLVLRYIVKIKTVISKVNVSWK